MKNKILIIPPFSNKDIMKQKGGASTFSISLMDSLRLKYNCTLMKNFYSDSNKISDSINTIIFVCAGSPRENSDEVEFRERISLIKKIRIKKKVILFVHDIKEFNTYRKSFEYFKEEPPNFIFTVTNKSDTIELIKSKMSVEKVYTINHPFVFEDKYFVNKKKYSKNIISCSRFASTKHIDTILDIAVKLEKKKIEFNCSEGGMYFYNFQKKHNYSYYVNNTKGNKYKHYSEPYSESAFGIDLSAYFSGKLLDGGRTQYCQIECIACGSIPIVFDCWKFKDGYEGIYLNNPYKDGNKIIIDIEDSIKKIEKAKYSYDMAMYNYEKIKKYCDIKTVCEQFDKGLKESI